MSQQAKLIVQYLLNEGHSKDEIAKMAGFTSRRMIDYTLEGVQRQIGRKAIQAIASSLGLSEMEINAKAIAFGEKEMGRPSKDDLYFVPLLDARPRGGEGGHETDQQVVDWLAFHTSYLQSRGNPDDMRLFEVAGESMAPTLKERDTILVDTGSIEIVPDNIYLFVIDDTFLVKRAGIKPGFILLKSDNKDKETYPDIEISTNEGYEHFSVYGRVLWAAREF